MSNTVEDAKREAGNLGKTIEKNTANLMNEWSYAISTGDYNNFDQTLQSTFNPAYAFIEDGGKYKESNVQRKEREEIAKAENAALEQKKAKEDERLRGLADLLSASAQSRRLAPGMSQTLLGGGSNPGLLVTGK